MTYMYLQFYICIHVHVYMCIYIYTHGCAHVIMESRGFQERVLSPGDGGRCHPVARTRGGGAEGARNLQAGIRGGRQVTRAGE